MDGDACEGGWEFLDTKSILVIQTTTSSLSFFLSRSLSAFCPALTSMCGCDLGS